MSAKQPKSFAIKLLEGEGGAVRLLTSHEQGKRAWFVLELDPALYKNYKSALRAETMNICDYGTILQCGWGKPPAEIVKRYAA